MKRPWKCLLTSFSSRSEVFSTITLFYYFIFIIYHILLWKVTYDLIQWKIFCSFFFFYVGTTPTLEVYNDHFFISVSWVWLLPTTHVWLFLKPWYVYLLETLYKYVYNWLPWVSISIHILSIAHWLRSLNVLVWTGGVNPVCGLIWMKLAESSMLCIYDQITFKANIIQDGHPS